MIMHGFLTLNKLFHERKSVLFFMERRITRIRLARGDNYIGLHPFIGIGEFLPHCIVAVYIVTISTKQKCGSSVGFLIQLEKLRYRVIVKLPVIHAVFIHACALVEEYVHKEFPIWPPPYCRIMVLPLL